MCSAVLRDGSGASNTALCTGMTNWPNTIQCLGSDDIMSLGIKSSAFLRVEHPFARKFDMSSTSWYMGAKYFQEFGPRFLGMTHKWIWI